MTRQIHGHEVIEMMVASNRAYSKGSLKAAVIGKFGPGARFQTCSAESMDAVELIEFLAQRGKLAESAGGYSINPDKVCQH